MKYCKVLSMVTASLIYLTSCTKEDAYKKFHEGGEIVYAGTLDSVIAQAGKNRINLHMNLGSDVSVTKVNVYWNDKLDSAQLDIQRPAASDVVNLLIPDLAAGTYNFQLFTYDNQGNSSVVKEVSGIAYGEDYENSLVNRRITSVSPSTHADSLVLTWNDPNPGLVKTDLTYAKKNGELLTISVSPAEMITRLPDDYLGGSTLSYRSTYKFDINAYDSYTVPEPLTLTLQALPPFERQLPKADFREVVLPTDMPDGPFQWYVRYLWNGTYTGEGYASPRFSPLPARAWFTFDTGVSTKLNRFIYHMPADRIFKDEAVKTFEVWGSNDPNPDGGFDESWTKLATCTSVKPSGSPLGTTTPGDVAAAEAGQEFIFPDNIPKVRYIRIVINSNWGNGEFFAMGELTFYTRDRIAN